MADDRKRERRRRRRERAQAKANTRAERQARAYWAEIGPDRLAGYYWEQNEQRVPMDRLYNRSFDLRYAEAERRARVPLPEIDDRDEYVIRAATIDTAYASFYRFHSRAHFRRGVAFPRNWVAWPEKVQRAERFSPPGVVGWYWGLTLGAAWDEALYYGGGRIDPASHILLTIECCFSNVLYLASPRILHAVWSKVGLPSMPSYEMLLAIMHPDTSNEYTDRIGLWARARGLDGIIFPTARYAQRLHAADWVDLRDGARTFLAVVNHIALHSRLDIMGGGPHMRAGFEVGHREAYLRERKISHDAVQEVPADLNLVLFSGHQLDGSRDPIFYQAMPTTAWREIADQETRRTTWQDTFKAFDPTGEVVAGAHRMLDQAIKEQQPSRVHLDGAEAFKFANGTMAIRYGPPSAEVGPPDVEDLARR